MEFKLRDFNLPENIFYFHNTDGEPLSFLLDCDTTDNFYAKLLKRHFATVVNKIDEYSMVLTIKFKSKYYHDRVPAFDITFIEDCFTLKEYPDPTKYLVRNSYPLNYTKQNIFDCWFHHKQTWSQLSVVDNLNKNVNEVNMASSPNEETHIISLDSDDNNVETKCSTSTNPTYCTNTDKRTRIFYSHDEDKRILEYIVKHEYETEIYGNRLWQMMERANICKIRTWQSMKERFLKHIKFDLISRPNKYPFLTPANLKHLRKCLKLKAVKGQ